MLKRYLCLSLFVPLLVMTVASQTYAKKSKTKTNIVSAKFSPLPIDLTVDNLQPKYIGHDIKAIYNYFANRNRVLTKDEFETTSDFNKRKESEDKKPILGNLTNNDYFAISKTADFSYDADNEIINLSVNTQYVQGGTKYEDNAIGIEDRRILTKQTFYNASNALGVTKEITDEKYESYVLSVVNPAVLGYKKNDRFTNGISYQLKNVVISKARQSKDKLFVLFIYKPISPFITHGSNYRDATIDNPWTYFENIYYVHAKLHESWIYNKDTGEILLKERY